MTIAIDIKHVTRTYGSGVHQVHALKDVSLEIEAGRFIALKGRSGSGKTTLLNCVGGLDKPTSGTIQVGEKVVTDMSEKALTQWRKRSVGFIFQAFGLLPSLSAFENVELMLRISQVSRRERKERAILALEQVGLAGLQHHRLYELSGGQAQRVAIARAVATRPGIILADEATGELDTETTHEILGTFHTLTKQHGTTILLATHDELVERYVDQTIHLVDGRCVTEP